MRSRRGDGGFPLLLLCAEENTEDSDNNLFLAMGNNNYALQRNDNRWCVRTVSTKPFGERERERERERETERKIKRERWGAAPGTQNHHCGTLSVVFRPVQIFLFSGFFFLFFFLSLQYHSRVRII